MTTTSHHIASVVRRVPSLIQAAYYAYRFIQPKFTIGVVGIVFNEKREVLIVEHVYHPQLPWGLPGGWVGFNEDPALTVVRELKEELGLTVTIEKLVHAARTKYHHLDMAFTCQASNTVGTLSSELLSWRYCPTDALPRLHSFQYHAIMNATEARSVQK